MKIAQPERVLNQEVIDLGEGHEVVIPNNGVPTQVASPGQATRRTVAAVILGLAVVLPIVNTILLIVQEELVKASDLTIPAWVWATLNIAIALVAALSGIVTRVLAIPGVNEWVTAKMPFLAPHPQVEATE
jgi:hypothetical protein